jgi:hypothetical protein
MPYAPRYVLSATHDGHSQITRLFDFINPAAIALWNLRWQVKGFRDSYPEATHDTLSKRFALGSGRKGGELYRACIETTWEEQQEEFAAIILVNAIAAFEDFTQSLAEKAGVSPARQIAEALQFPVRTPPQQVNGHDWAFSQFGPSTASMRGVFYMAHNARRYAGFHLNNLLTCYRYFKSLRNMLAHNGGRANQQMVDAYQAFSTVATKTALGLSEVPQHHPVVLGQEVKIELRGVIGLCDVILRIMTTYDAELSDRRVAEIEFDERTPPLSGKLIMPPSDPVRRDAKIQALVTAGRFPKAVITPALKQHLKDSGKLPAFW